MSPGAQNCTDMSPHGIVVPVLSCLLLINHYTILYKDIYVGLPGGMSRKLKINLDVPPSNNINKQKEYLHNLIIVEKLPMLAFEISHLIRLVNAKISKNAKIKPMCG